MVVAPKMVRSTKPLSAGGGRQVAFASFDSLDAGVDGRAMAALHQRLFRPRSRGESDKMS